MSSARRRIRRGALRPRARSRSGIEPLHVVGDVVLVEPAIAITVHHGQRQRAVVPAAAPDGDGYSGGLVRGRCTELAPARLACCAKVRNAGSTRSSCCQMTIRRLSANAQCMPTWRIGPSSASRRPEQIVRPAATRPCGGRRAPPWPRLHQPSAGIAVRQHGCGSARAIAPDAAPPRPARFPADALEAARSLGAERRSGAARVRWYVVRHSATPSYTGAVGRRVVRIACTRTTRPPRRDAQRAGIGAIVRQAPG